MPKIRLKNFGLSIFLLLLTACGSDPQQKNLSGGFNLANIVSLTPVIDFGINLINTEKVAQVTIQNIGSETASNLQGSFAIDVFGFTGGAFPGTNGTCGTFLSPKQTCIIELKFSVSYQSSFEDFIRIDFFDGAQNNYSRTPIVRGSSVESIQ